MFSVIIVMAGTGSRLKQEINKALVKINNKEMFRYSLDTFKKYNCQIILVVNNDDYNYINNSVSGVDIVVGGDTRSKSVYNGLSVVKYDKVLIHDAARPFISCNIIDNILLKLETLDAAYVCVKLKDTIKQIGSNDILNRDNYLLAQTPQGFSTKEIINAYDNCNNSNDIFTDDISIYAKYNQNKEIGIVMGDDYNYKITTPLDLKIAEILVGDIND